MAHPHDSSDNAHLIAAASDMLAALVAVREFINSDPSDAPLDERSARLAQAWFRGAVGARIEIAIALAEGRR